MFYFYKDSCIGNEVNIKYLEECENNDNFLIWIN